MTENDANHWRDMAARTRKQGDASLTEGAKAALHKMADDFDAEADRLYRLQDGVFGRPNATT